MNNENENKLKSNKMWIISLIVLGIGYALYRYGLYLDILNYGFIGGILIWVGYIIIVVGSGIMYLAVLETIENFFNIDIKPDSNANNFCFIIFVILMGCAFYWSDYRYYYWEDLKPFLFLLAVPLVLGIIGGIIYSLVQINKRDKALEALDVSSTKLFRDILPDMCFVAAPLIGNAPDDLAQWAKTNQNLMMASLLNINEPKEFELFTKKVNEYGVKTILIPEIADEDIKAKETHKGSILHRSCEVMTNKLGRDPKEFEYLTSVFEQDALGTGSLVGFCFVFKK